MTRRTLLAATAVLLFLGCGCRGTDSTPGTVTGTVRADNRPVSPARVEALLVTAGSGTGPVVAYADERGAFTLTLPPGAYSFSARGEGSGSRRLAGSWAKNPLRLAAGETKSIEIDLQPASGATDAPGPATSGIEGVVTGGGPVVGSFVYAYPEGARLTGPGYASSAPVDEKGRYRLPLPPGRYRVVARRKGAGEKVGFVARGDATGSVAGDFVEVPPDSFSRLPDILLHPVDERLVRERESGRAAREGKTGIAGRVVGADGRPVPGMHVLLYSTPQMIGRPAAVAGADAAGNFILPLASGGRYYLGARQNRSGPRQPGEMAGGYDGSPDHGLDVRDGGWLEGLVIRVEEVW